MSILKISEKKLIEAAQELAHIDRYDGELTQFKEQFWDNAECATLNSIIEQDKFNTEYGYAFNSQYTIPKLVLRDFRYGSEVRANDPKAALAKKLGAKVIS